MHWWGNASTGQVKRSVSSPGPGWAQFPPSTDHYTLAQIQAFIKAHKETAPVDNSIIGQDISGGKKAAGKAASSLINLPSLTNTRPFVGRVIKVIIGTGLILVGLTMLVKQEANISVGDVAKVAAL